MITGKYPNLRLRRSRKYTWSRSLIEENNLSSNDFIYPIFLIEGKNKKQHIKSMPDVYRYTIDRLGSLVNNAVKNKIFKVLGNTSIEDAKASVQSDKENILKLVREGDGGCAALDIKVNELIRNWNKESLYGFLEDAKVDISGKYKRIYWFR